MKKKPIAKIISTIPWTVSNIPKPWNSYEFVAAPRDGYTVVEVQDVKMPKFVGIDPPSRHGESQIPFDVHPAVDIARDVARTFYEQGVFVITTEEATDKQAEDWKDEPVYFESPEVTSEMLAKAAVERKKFYAKQLAEGDKIYSRTQNVKQVSEISKRSANQLGVEREWAIDHSMLESCEACQSQVSPKAVKCPKCHAIRDWDRAVIMGLKSQAEYEFAKGLATPVVKRGPGRPRKDEAVV